MSEEPTYKKSNYQATKITDGDMCLKATELFHVRDQLMQLRREYRTAVARVKRLELEANFKEAVGIEKFSEWEEAAHKNLEVKKAIEEFGKSQVGFIAPFKNDFQDDIFLCIISSDDANRQAQHKALDAAMDMLRRMHESMEKTKEEDDEN